MSQEYDPYHKYLNGHSDQEDNLDKEVKAFLDQVGSVEVPEFNKSKEHIWNAIDSKVEGEEEHEAKVVPLNIWKKVLR